MFNKGIKRKRLKPSLKLRLPKKAEVEGEMEE
jgi:hypothetical protein